MRFIQHSSHGCNFFYILVSLKKGVHMERNEIFESNVNFSYNLGPHEKGGAFVGSAMGGSILNLTLMKPRSLIELQSSFN